MEMWEFFDNHWFIAWCALWLLWGVVPIAYIVLFRLPNRLLRSIKVLVRGWPPEHLDADGDFKPAPKEEEE